MIAIIETQRIPEPGVLERWENEGGSTRLLVLAPHEVQYQTRSPAAASRQMPSHGPDDTPNQYR